jgi:hypothetical protein
MTTTDGSTEPAAGAIPQPGSERVDATEALRLTSRSGDTDVAFRLDRERPWWRQVMPLVREGVYRLTSRQRWLAAGGLALVLAVTIPILATRGPDPVASPPGPPAVAREPAKLVAPVPAQPIAAPPPVVAQPVVSEPARPTPARVRPAPPRQIRAKAAASKRGKPVALGARKPVRSAPR